jgi:hypothetical protein
MSGFRAVAQLKRVHVLNGSTTASHEEVHHEVTLRRCNKTVDLGVRRVDGMCRPLVPGELWTRIAPLLPSMPRSFRSAAR